MSSVRTICPRCGEVEMRADAISLHFDWDKDEGTYSFVCPVCEDLVEKPADGKIARLLRGAGAEIEEIPLPAELPESRPTGPPLEIDDVVDLHNSLKDEVKVAEELRGL